MTENPALNCKDAWIAEAERRMEEVRSGRMIDADEVLAESLKEEIDPAILERARRTMEDIRAGRVKTVPAEEVLDMLDRMAS